MSFVHLFIKLIDKFSYYFAYLKGFILFGKKVHVGKGVRFVNLSGIKIGYGCYFSRGVIIDASKGEVILKNNVYINSYSNCNSAGGKIIIEENTTIGDFCNLYG